MTAAHGWGSEDDPAGLKIFEELKKTRFVPVVFYTEVVAGNHVVRIIIQGLSKLFYGFVELSVHAESHAKKVVDAGEVGGSSRRQRLRVICGRVDSFHAGQRVAQVLERIFVVGFDLKGFEVIKHRLVQPPFIIKGQAETVEGDEIIFWWWRLRDGKVIRHPANNPVEHASAPHKFPGPIKRRTQQPCRATANA